MAKRQLRDRPPRKREVLAEAPRQAGDLTTTEVRLAVLIGSALLVLLFARYVGQDFEALRWGFFFWGTAAAYVVVPLILCPALGIPLSNLGLGRPQLSWREARWLLAAVALATLVALLLLGMKSYQSRYQISSSRISDWLSFLVSTILSWEFFHRAFVLFGVREILRAGGHGRAADTVAILFTTCFEVLSHLHKPPHESFALLLGSPLMSWFALRHRAVWIPSAGHVWMEFLWFMSVWR
jgi:hypothetical protein